MAKYRIVTLDPAEYEFQRYEVQERRFFSWYYLGRCLNIEECEKLIKKHKANREFKQEVVREYE